MIRGFPFYQQHDEMDCGATCLRMVARYHGRFFSLESLRQLTYIGKQGVTMLGISDAAEHIGLQTLAVQTTYDQLQRVIPLPCIAHWNDNHFVVVYKVTDRYVWIADPAQDKFKISKEAFLQHWTGSVNHDAEPQGVLLLLQTTPEFFNQEGEQLKKSGWGYVLRCFRSYRRLMSQLLFGLV
ncbi:MAG: peptidase domain-containing ABC transporter, partial [Saprospiraceae bacterium]|nr:peptidase domain-containing ABC transporter [Saprospiraceae bacterium]